MWKKQIPYHFHNLKDVKHITTQKFLFLRSPAPRSIFIVMSECSRNELLLPCFHTYVSFVHKSRTLPGLTNAVLSRAGRSTVLSLFKTGCSSCNWVSYAGNRTSTLTDKKAGKRGLHVPRVFFILLIEVVHKTVWNSSRWTSFIFDLT